jgi:hypothetical protein
MWPNLIRQSNHLPRGVSARRNLLDESDLEPDGGGRGRLDAIFVLCLPVLPRAKPDDIHTPHCRLKLSQTNSIQKEDRGA